MLFLISESSSHMLTSFNSSWTFALAKIRRVKFTRAEDEQLRALVAKYGVHAWQEISEEMGTRNIRQCRDRWNHYLSANSDPHPWTGEEDRRLHGEMGPIGQKGKSGQAFSPTRSEPDIRKRWDLLEGENAIPKVGPPIPIPMWPDSVDSILSRADGTSSTIADEEPEMDLFYPDDW
jgi:hypothetical protein